MVNRIKDVIKEQGYTIKSLAEKMGMARESLSRIIVNPSSPTLEKLSKELNVPVWQFFASKEEVLSTMTPSSGVVCPHCGQPLRIEIKQEE